MLLKVLWQFLAYFWVKRTNIWSTAVRQVMEEGKHYSKQLQRLPGNIHNLNILQKVFSVELGQRPGGDPLSLTSSIKFTEVCLFTLPLMACWQPKWFLIKCHKYFRRTQEWEETQTQPGVVSVNVRKHSSGSQHCPSLFKHTKNRKQLTSVKSSDLNTYFDTPNQC